MGWRERRRRALFIGELLLSLFMATILPTNCIYDTNILSCLKQFFDTKWSQFQQLWAPNLTVARSTSRSCASMMVGREAHWFPLHVTSKYLTCFLFLFIFNMYWLVFLFITSVICSSSFGKKIHPNPIAFELGCKLWFQGREICTLASLCHGLPRVTILLHRHPGFTNFERSSFERWGIGEDSISTRSIWMYRIT